ncbi:hypothetical protein CF326_g6281 [Tilletia indica]|nr:hypothetical protein CF326_g6281 [Tilletia indica]
MDKIKVALRSSVATPLLRDILRGISGAEARKSADFRTAESSVRGLQTADGIRNGALFRPRLDVPGHPPSAVRPRLRAPLQRGIIPSADENWRTSGGRKRGSRESPPRSRKFVHSLNSPP